MNTKNSAAWTIALLCSLIGGCATMSESECRHANWRDIGLRDGLDGQSMSLLDDRTNDCRKAGVTVDSGLYVAGREQGLRSFCRMENAIPLGLQGASYEGVCPPLIDGEFRRRHQLGYAVYSLRGEINAIDNRSEALQRQLRETDRDEEKALRDADFSKDDLLARGWRPAKAQQLLASLVAKRVVEQVEELPGSYRVTGLVPVHAGFRAVSVAFAAEPLAIEPRLIHGAALSQAAVVRAVEALVPEAQVRSLSVVYVPVFAADLERPDGVRRRELIDGITGEPLGR